MSRRRKRIFITIVLLTVPFVLTSLQIWRQKQHQMYIPGADVEGVTAKLNRDIPAEYSAVIFQDVSERAGIHFNHFNHNRTSSLPEDMGSGVAWIDYDNDGWEDLFIVNFALPIDREMNGDNSKSYCALYQNNGDGTFTEVSEQAGVSLALRGMGVAAGDYDNDGWTDLFISAYGLNHLLKNNGNGTFSDVTHQAGMGNYPGFWAGATWGDYDRDGDIDLYVTGYVKYADLNLSAEDLQVEEPPSINPSAFQPERNLLYRNNGDGTFVELAQQAHVDNITGRSLSATWTDFNGDMWPDLYVANDVSDNVLYLNKKDGTFEDISHGAHVADYRGAMGIASGDWDNDQDPDLFITHWVAQENALYNNLRNDPVSNHTSTKIDFTDDSNVCGLGQSSLDYVAWATSFVDLDMDGRLDLFVVNGSTLQSPDDYRKLKPMNSQIYWNAGRDRGFYDVSEVSGDYFGEEHVGRGGAYADYDHDGDEDLFIVNHNGAGVLLQNTNELGNNWLSVRLEGVESNRSAMGAAIRIVTGEINQTRMVGAQSSYLSQNSRVQHFGLGSNVTADTLEIQWPGGITNTFYHIPANQYIYIKEGDSQISIVKQNNDLL